MAKGYSIRVKIGGRSFGIISDEKPEYLTEVAESVDKSISTLLAQNSKMTFERAAVLSALKFCDDSKKYSIPHVEEKDEIKDKESDNLRHRIMEYSKELSKLTREYKALEKELKNVKKEYEEKLKAVSKKLDLYEQTMNK